MASYEIEVIVRKYDDNQNLVDDWSCGTLGNLDIDNGDNAVEVSIDAIKDHPVLGQLDMTLDHVGSRPSDR